MKVELKRGNKYYCDVCGEEIEFGADFEIEFDYGCEDPCWGSFYEEDKLIKELGNKDCEISKYLQQNILNQCDNCRECGENNYISDFERAFRKARVEIVRKLALEKKLPEFFDKEEENKECLAQLETKKKQLLDELTKIDKKINDFYDKKRNYD